MTARRDFRPERYRGKWEQTCARAFRASGGVCLLCGRTEEQIQRTADSRTVFELHHLHYWSFSLFLYDVWRWFFPEPDDPKKPQPSRIERLRELIQMTLCMLTGRERKPTPIGDWGVVAGRERVSGLLLDGISLCRCCHQSDDGVHDREVWIRADWNPCYRNRNTLLAKWHLRFLFVSERHPNPCWRILGYTGLIVVYLIAKFL
jgi:hypothetical protein